MNPLSRIILAIVGCALLHILIETGRDVQVQASIKKFVPHAIKALDKKNEVAHKELAFIALDKAYTDTHSILGATPAIRHAIYIKETKRIWDKMLASHATISDKLRFDGIVNHTTKIMIGA